MRPDDPVSWLVVERGWKVVGRDGDELGAVEEVLGDQEKDIFNGLTVARGFFGSARYVPAERVRSIADGRIVVDVGRREFERLDDYVADPTAEPPS